MLTYLPNVKEFKRLSGIEFTYHCRENTFSYISGQPSCTDPRSHQSEAKYFEKNGLTLNIVLLSIILTCTSQNAPFIYICHDSMFNIKYRIFVQLWGNKVGTLMSLLF